MGFSLFGMRQLLPFTGCVFGGFISFYLQNG
jgi:hypothetical protein